MNSNELNTIFTNTADSLRAKLGSTEKYKPETFSGLVDSLEVKQYPLIGNIFASLDGLSTSQTRFYLMDGYTGEQPTKFKLTKSNYNRQVAVNFDNLDKFVVSDGHINATMQTVNDYIMLDDTRVLYRVGSQAVVVGYLTNGMPLGEMDASLPNVNITLAVGTQIPTGSINYVKGDSYPNISFCDYDTDYFFMAWSQKDSGYSTKTGKVILYKVRKSDLTIVAASNSVSTTLASITELHMVSTVYNNKVYVYLLQYSTFDELFEFTTDLTYVTKTQISTVTSGKNWFYAFGCRFGRYWVISGSTMNRVWEVFDLDTKRVVQFEQHESSTETAEINLFPNLTMDKMYAIKNGVAGLYELKLTSSGTISDETFTDANKVADGSFDSIMNIYNFYTGGTASGTARLIEERGLVLFGVQSAVQTGWLKLINVPDGYLDGVIYNINRTSNRNMFDSEKFNKEIYIYPTNMLDVDYSADKFLNLAEYAYDAANNLEFIDTNEAAYLNYDDNGKFSYVAKISVTRENNVSAARSATPCVLSTPYVYYKGNKYTLKYYTNKTATPTDLTSVSSLY